MIDHELIKAEFSKNGLTPYAIHIKYKIDIDQVYEILKTIPRTVANNKEEHF